MMMMMMMMMVMMAMMMMIAALLQIWLFATDIHAGGWLRYLCKYLTQNRNRAGLATGSPIWQESSDRPKLADMQPPSPPLSTPFPPQDPFLPHPRPHDATNVGKKPGNQPEPERAPVPHDTALVAAFLCRVELGNEVTIVGPFTSQIPPL